MVGSPIIFARGGQPDQRFADAPALARLLFAKAVLHGGPIRVRLATVARSRAPSGASVCVHLGEDDAIEGYAFGIDPHLTLERLSAALRALAAAEAREDAA